MTDMQQNLIDQLKADNARLKAGLEEVQQRLQRFGDELDDREQEAARLEAEHHVRETIFLLQLSRRSLGQRLTSWWMGGP